MIWHKPANSHAILPTCSHSESQPTKKKIADQVSNLARDIFYSNSFCY